MMYDSRVAYNFLMPPAYDSLFSSYHDFVKSFHNKDLYSEIQLKEHFASDQEMFGIFICKLKSLQQLSITARANFIYYHYSPNFGLTRESRYECKILQQLIWHGLNISHFINILDSRKQFVASFVGMKETNKLTQLHFSHKDWGIHKNRHISQLVLNIGMNKFANYLDNPDSWGEKVSNVYWDREYA